MLVGSISFARAAAGDDRLDVPPSGLVPTTARLSEILKAHQAAIGTRSPGAIDSVVETWTLVEAGLSGTEELQRSGTNYHSRIVEGPFADEYGQDGAQRWHQDSNGFSSLTTGSDMRSFYGTRVLGDAADPKNDVTVLGQTSGAHAAYVVEVKLPDSKHPEFVFYDKANAQIVRDEFVFANRRIVGTFDDFRATGGISRAWHIHDTDGRPELDDDLLLRSLQYGVSLPPETFEIPPNRPTVSDATTVMRLPARPMWLNFYFRKLWGGYLVRMDVGGRGLDFLIDSAASRSIIDWDVAHEMGLPTYGQTTRLADGTAVAYRTTIAHAMVGGISLHNFALDSERFAYQPDPTTKIVGVLGYDFFAANVLHFDFVDGTIDALPLADFGAVAPVKDGVDIPYALDNGLPLVSVFLGDAFTAHAVLSTSMPFSMILGSFVAAHPDQTRDVSGKPHGEGTIPLADAGTYGLNVEHWTALLSHFRFAISDYKGVGVESTNAPLVVNDQPIDALIGIDYLHYYDLYFDYPYGRLIVKPNAIFFKTFKKDG